jgi:restriction system protein
MPYRPSYRPRRKRPVDNRETFAAVVGVVVLGSIALFLNLPEQQAIYLFAACISVLIVGALGVAWYAIEKERLRKRKLHAMTIAGIAKMTGVEFEKYLAELLRIQGFSDISLTETYDLGVDIIARKDGELWGIQAKRYKGLVKADAVRQVVTALNQYHCQRSMVITNSHYISRPARKLAASNGCVLIDGFILEDWVLQYRSYMRD